MSGRSSLLLLAVVAVVALLYIWMREDETPRAERSAVETSQPEPERVKRAPPPKPDPKFVAVEVILRKPDDSPVPRVAVRVENLNAVTDADGIARFPKAPYALLHVRAFRREIGTISPRDGESRLVYTVKDTVDLVVRVTTSGKARIPDGFRVTDPVLIGAVVDQAAAEVRGAFIPPADQTSFFVTARAPGFGTTDKLVAIGRRRPIKVDLELVPTTRVTVDVAGPLWTLNVIELERPRILRRSLKGGGGRPPGPHDWKPAGGGRRASLNDQQIRWELAPGLYRLRLKNTPIVFHEFEVGRDSVQLSIDLTRADEQQIRLLAPEPFDLGSATLFMEWLDLPYSDPQTSIVLPGDRELEIVARHPLLRQRRAGPLRLAQAGDPVTIEMVPRTLVRFELPASVKGRVEASLNRRTAPIGGYGKGHAFVADPGKYTLQVFADGVELHKRKLTVPEGGLDLGLLPIR